MRHIHNPVIYHINSIAIPLKDYLKTKALVDNGSGDGGILERAGDCPRGRSHSCSECPHIHSWNKQSLAFDCLDIGLHNMFLRRKLSIDPATGKGKIQCIINYRDAIIMEIETPETDYQELAVYFNQHGPKVVAISEADHIMPNIANYVVVHLYEGMSSDQIFVEKQ